MNAKEILARPEYQNPLCQECIKAQLEKYNSYVDDDGYSYADDFVVSCRGIPESYIRPEWRSMFKPDVLDQIETLYDPVAWAKKYAKQPNGEPWIARWYQEVILRCTARNRVTRLGRRLGKCLAEGTQVMTPNGAVAIETLCVGDTVYAYNVDTDSVTPTQIIQVHDQGLQEVVDLSHNQKFVASCTPVHRWHTTLDCNRGGDRVRQLNEFKKGVAITRRFIDLPMGNIHEPHAYAIGALLGDGCSKERGCKIYLSSEDGIIPAKTANLLGCVARKTSSRNYTWVIEHPDQSHIPIQCNHYNEWCRDKYAHEKICDLNVIKTWDRESCLAFLAGLLDTDGCVRLTEDGCLSIGWSMQATSVIEAIKWLVLSLFQYDASVGIDDRDKYKNGPVSYLHVKNNIVSKRLLQALDPYLVVSRKKWDPKYNDLQNNDNQNYFGVTFNIEKTHLAHCYDISVDTKDNLYLLANGLVTHNTDSLAIFCLWLMYTNKNKRVLVVTPYKSQAEEIFNRMKSFIDSNPELADGFRGMVATPYFKLTLNNGSRARGFTSGAKSGSEAGNVRGQDADVIVFDEADYLDAKDLDSIVAIVATHPNVLVWASSTPSGKREHFWRWCTSHPAYKEFYHPTTMLPHWKEIERSMRSEYQGRPDAWRHEVMAEFGEQSTGVFQHGFIERSIQEYSYDAMRPAPGWIYSIGVDWNKNRGTEICVVGLDPQSLQVKVVETLNVPKQEFTQVKGMEAIIALNIKWRPQFIYVDEGHGATNIELLRKYGFESGRKDPDGASAALYKIVRTYNFSSKIEIRDPVTKSIIKKDAKPFLVETAVKVFEDNRITLSASDTLLRKQLDNYIVKHYTITGRPVYGLIDEDLGDHRLDALMLSLVGYKLELSDFGRPDFVNTVGMIPSVPASEKRVDLREEAAARLAAIPTDRFDLQNDQSQAYGSVPGMTDGGQISTNRPGFMTDTEELLKKQYALRRMQKLQKQRGSTNRPRRSNI